MRASVCVCVCVCGVCGVCGVCFCPYKLLTFRLGVDVLTVSLQEEEQRHPGREVPPQAARLLCCCKLHTCLTNGKRHKHTDTHTARQRHTDRQTDIQIHTHALTHAHVCVPAHDCTPSSLALPSNGADEDAGSHLQSAVAVACEETADGRQVDLEHRRAPWWRQRDYRLV